MTENDFDFQKLKAQIEANKERIQEGLEKGKDQAFELFKAFLARMSPERAAMYAGLAYLGYERLPDFIPTMARLMTGPVGIELATTPVTGGEFSATIFGVKIPVNSQIAGLTMLASLGFACLPWEELEKQIQNDVDRGKRTAASYRDAINLYGSVMTDDERKELDALYLAVTSAMLGTQEDYRLACESLLGYIEGMTATWEQRLLESGRAPGQGSAR